MTALAPDKLKHIKGGAAVALAAGAAWFALWAITAPWPAAHRMVPLAALPAVMVMSAAVAGVVKEAADLMDNRAAAALGQPAPHAVDPWDAAYTVLPALLLAAMTQALLTARIFTLT